MGSRERKRAERRKRKERAGARPAEVTGDTVTLAEETAVDSEGAAGAAGGEVSPAERRRAAAEARNQAARDSLEPLGKGERPTVVTVGAVVSAIVSLSVFIAYAAGAEVEGERPHISQVIASGAIFAAMAYGMWNARYWAVLGFQAISLIFLVLAALSLASATDLLDAASYVVVMAISGAFFWFGVKAMARIQMPERP